MTVKVKMDKIDKVYTVIHNYTYMQAHEITEFSVLSIPCITFMYNTSVVDSTTPPYLNRSSMILIRFFLQAMCRGVKPF